MMIRDFVCREHSQCDESEEGNTTILRLVTDVETSHTFHFGNPSLSTEYFTIGITVWILLCEIDESARWIGPTVPVRTVTIWRIPEVVQTYRYDTRGRLPRKPRQIATKPEKGNVQ